MNAFSNEPLTDFSAKENIQAFESALQKVESEAGRIYPLVIDGKEVDTKGKFKSVNPSDPSRVLAVFSKAGRQEARDAIAAALRAFPDWSSLSAKDRAWCLFEAAKKMRQRKHEFSAAMVLECGKSWVEADADTAEAIDFMEFYGREALRYAEKQPLTQISAEHAELFYIPLGVGAVIPPWNFPLAILVGMTTAALVSGNTVVLKPSSDSPWIGFRFFKLMQEIGLPAGVLNFMPGSGAECGEELVCHPKTRFISFTGSKEVGLHIIEEAAKHRPGQIWIKRVVAEMGGKDTIVVDEDCDIDGAVAATVSSAYGFSGQKCSACSRVIVHGKIYDVFKEKLLAMVKTIKVGDVRDPSMFMGPVINEASLNKCLSYVDIGKREGALIQGGNKLNLPGYFLEPTVFENIKPGARLDQEEIFGPILAMLKADDFETALKIANATEYGLTGAVWSRDRNHIEKARREFFVGNLYFNRKCTGALVGVHPFGGFNMSGTDSKAGGRDYLLLFLQAKSVSEKIA